nr:hypothetical protein [Tanacetum cinerariifolium]
RVDVLIDRRQAGVAFGMAITAIVQQQHLVPLLGKPIAAAQVPGHVAAVTVQVQHRALDRNAGFRGQKPGIELFAVGGRQGQITVRQVSLFRGQRDVSLRVEQQFAATGEGQEQQQREQRLQAMSFYSNYPDRYGQRQARARSRLQGIPSIDPSYGKAIREYSSNPPR